MPECERCDRWFNSERSLWQHKEDSNNHHICYDCNRDFRSAHALVQHYVQSSRHHYCQRCDEHFNDHYDLLEHYEDDHYYCSSCGRFFEAESHLHAHYRQSHADRYCVPCKRLFQTANNLGQHLRSSIHQGRTVICPAKGCGRAFVSRAALILHFEGGSCKSGLTRAKVDELVAKFDKSGIITDPSRLLTGPGSAPRVIDRWATERAWNGDAYECYLCHREFGTLDSLNKHLRSPAHGEKLYRCPEDWRGCGARFSTLSAFVQHVESGQCGMYRFKSQMERFIDDFTTRGRLTAG